MGERCSLAHPLNSISSSTGSFSLLTIWILSFEDFHFSLRGSEHSSELWLQIDSVIKGSHMFFTGGPSAPANICHSEGSSPGSTICHSEGSSSGSNIQDDFTSFHLWNVLLLKREARDSGPAWDDSSDLMPSPWTPWRRTPESKVRGSYPPDHMTILTVKYSEGWKWTRVISRSICELKDQTLRCFQLTHDQYFLDPGPFNDSSSNKLKTFLNHHLHFHWLWD